MRNTKLRRNIAVTLILALLLTGLGRPGFLLKLLDKGTEGGTSVNAVTPAPTTSPAGSVETPFPGSTSEEEAFPVKGNSKAFSAELLPGVRVSAEKDALDRDREFTLTELEPDAFCELQEHLLDAGAALDIFCAWELDAGLSDDERFPGVYHVAVELAGRGIPEEYWDYLKAYRMDEAGNVYEYVTWVEDGVLHYESSQNSWLLIGLSVALVGTIAYYFTAFPYEKTGLGYWDPDGDYCVQDPANPKSTKIKVVYAKVKLAQAMYKDKLAIEDKRVFNAAFKEARAQLPAGGEGFQELVNKLKAEKLANDEAYKKVLSSYRNEAGEAQAISEKIGALELMAYEYLKSTGLKVPDYCIEVRMCTAMEDAGQLSAPIMKTPFIKFNVDEVAEQTQEKLEEALLSLTHETFHACQLLYVGTLTTNLKFNEATAQLLEEQAREYFKTHTGSDGRNIIEKNHPLSNGWQFQYFAMPMDKTTVTYDDGAGGTTEWTVDDVSKAGYAQARFLEYLNENHKKLSIKEMMEKYQAATKWSDLNGEFMVPILKSMYKLNDDEFSKHWLGFAQKYKVEFYETAKAKWKELSAVFPWTRVEGSVQHVTLRNYNYDIRVRMITPGNYGGSYAVLVEPDKDFLSTLNDMSLLPVGPGNWSKCKAGVFLEPRSFQERAWLMEVDGGSNGRQNASSGYTIYIFKEPKLDDPAIDGEKAAVTLRLPKKSEAAEAERVTGYRVTVKCSDGKVTTRLEDVSKADSEILLLLSDLCQPEHRGDGKLTYAISVCEYWQAGDQQYFGPESRVCSVGGEQAWSDLALRVMSEDMLKLEWLETADAASLPPASVSREGDGFTISLAACTVTGKDGKTYSRSALSVTGTITQEQDYGKYVRIDGTILNSFSYTITEQGAKNGDSTFTAHSAPKENQISYFMLLMYTDGHTQMYVELYGMHDFISELGESYSFNSHDDFWLSNDGTLRDLYLLGS